MSIVYGTWNEDGSATCYARLMARDGTGVSVAGQGKSLKQADISAITFAVYRGVGGVWPTTMVNSGTVDIASCVFDTLKTSADDSAWTFSTGFNFRHDLDPVNFPEGNQTYTVEYKIVTTGGTVGWALFRGVATVISTP